MAASADQGFALIGQAFSYVVSTAVKWLKLAAVVLLLAFILFTLLKLLGFDFVPVQSVGFQELGVFLAGAAFALSKL